MEKNKTQDGGINGWLGRTNKKVLIGVLIVITAVTSLMVTQLRSSLTYYLTVDEIRAEGPKAYNERLRVGGRVLENTFERDASSNISFALYHNEPQASLAVQYRGALPDMFQEEGDVIVEGQWRSDGIFYATNVLVQHPPEFKIAEPGNPHNTDIVDRGQ
ncbi:cytochrome c maturation protein CcmE [Dehalococcoidia bacterium]|nr:cytochrome c maturation protein CcmE [Dehalococcoidia bacterium]